ncbi:hypothetical protein PM082_014273 [Marasmius tenuissimus]|nr:hypothetical protein PM082_014273 [Marasmius tenuissimus]
MLKKCLSGLLTVFYLNATVLCISQELFGFAASFQTPSSQVSSTERLETLYLTSSVRVRKTDLCNDTAQAYTGYIDIGARHFFFYFFESRATPEDDDVIFWTNGGPGGSTAIGLFVELGPCAILGENAVGRRVESWSNHANLLFVDQPVGTGFSFAEYGEYVDTTEDAALDMAVFVAKFFEHFSHFQGNGFHFAGESYAGRFLPVFASILHDQNSFLPRLGIPPVNLTSVMIGNGYTDIYTMIPSYYDITCTPASVPPILNIRTCVKIKQIIPRCEKWMKEACLDTFDHINCRAAFSYCREAIGGPYAQTELNPYDVSGKTCNGPDGEMCYAEVGHMISFLNLHSTRDKLGIDPRFRSNFTSVSMEVYNAFDAKLDQYKQTPLHVATLLERGIRVLVYVGNYDWVCNWVGNERWTLNLAWGRQREFTSTPLTEWYVDGRRAGVTRRTGPFTFATIEGGGHMAPMDKPKESLELVRRWISGEDL